MRKPKFSARELLFVKHYEGDQTKAAAAAKYADPTKSGWRLMNRPHVRAAIEQKLSQGLAANAEQFGKSVKVSRNDIINGLHTEATTADTPSARVSAWGHLAEIFKLKGKSDRNHDIFDGWTEEELDYYRRTGEIPASRFGLSAESPNDPSNRQAGLSASGLSTDHGPGLGPGGSHRSPA